MRDQGSIGRVSPLLSAGNAGCVIGDREVHVFFPAGVCTAGLFFSYKWVVDKVGVLGGMGAERRCGWMGMGGFLVRGVCVWVYAEARRKRRPFGCGWWVDYVGWDGRCG